MHPGATKPLLRAARHDPEIHGLDGLGGVEGLPDAGSPEVHARIDSVRAIEAMARAIGETWRGGAGERVVVVSSGPMTNVALFVSVYPELLDGVGRSRLGPRFSIVSPILTRPCRRVLVHGRRRWRRQPLCDCRYVTCHRTLGCSLIYGHSVLEFNILCDRTL